MNFISMMVALLSLVHMFAQKCARHIEIGAAANFFILSHRTPFALSLDSAPDQPGGGPATATSSRELSSTQGGSYQSLKHVQPSRVVLWLSEYFWCSVSMVVNISMAVLLQIAMFLKIATFTGAVEHVAVVAVSLYFVFEFDNKVLESDHKLRFRYRKQVLAQTEDRIHKPTWMNTISLLAALLLKLSVPFGLLSIILFSWKSSDGVVIGGDGITRT